MSNIPYTSKEMQDKFIVCFVLLSGKRPALDCVRHATGPHKGLPVLYKSIAHASFDKHFDPKWDDVIPAAEYFERVSSQENKVTKPNKAEL